MFEHTSSEVITSEIRAIAGHDFNLVEVNVIRNLPARNPIDGIRINNDIADKLGVSSNEDILIYDSNSKKYIQGRVIIGATEGNNILVRRVLFDRLKNDILKSDDDQFVAYAVSIPITRIRKIIPQRIKDMEDDKISVSEKIYDEYMNIDVQNFVLRHSDYGYSLTFSKNHLKPDKKLNDDSIRINMYQRLLTGTENPIYMICEHLRGISKTFKGADLEIINRDIACLEEIDRTSCEFQKKKEIDDLVKKYIDPSLMIIPLFTAKNNYDKEGLLTKISNSFVGDGRIQLRCGRPYQSDEGRRIVRLSSNNMSILGVNESDVVQIESAYSVTKARVFSFDEENRVRETNLMGHLFDNDVIVGIPVNIREKIRLSDIGTTVIIKRDTKFIFKKNMNIQIISIILFFISLYQIFNASFIPSMALAYSLISMILAYPIVTYLSLSLERSRVGWKKEKN